MAAVNVVKHAKVNVPPAMSVKKDVDVTVGESVGAPVIPGNAYGIVKETVREDAEIKNPNPRQNVLLAGPAGPTPSALAGPVILVVAAVSSLAPFRFLG